MRGIVIPLSETFFIIYLKCGYNNYRTICNGEFPKGNPRHYSHPQPHQTRTEDEVEVKDKLNEQTSVPVPSSS